MTEQTKTLLCLSPGGWGTVTAAVTEGGLGRRLADLGFTPGARVRCAMKSPFGDPAAYLIRGAVVALRDRDARAVKIEPDEDEQAGGRAGGRIGWTK